MLCVQICKCILYTIQHFRVILKGTVIIMKEKTAKKGQDLTQGPILSKILLFTLPLVATGLLQTLYNASDMIVVGNFSPAGGNAMGAVGACSALINLIINLFMGLSVGAGVMVAQYVGAGKYRDVGEVVHTSVLASLICGVVLAIFGFFMARPLLVLMNTQDAQLNEAVQYMKAYFLGAPACLLYNFCASILRSYGDTKRPLIILMISGLANVILNLIMVLCFGMGAVGVGIATSVSQYIASVMVIIYMLKTDTCCKIIPRKIKIHGDKLLQMIKVGLPAGVQGALFSISNVLIQSTVNAYSEMQGPEGYLVNGNAAAANIEAFIYVGMNSLYQAAVTFVGQHVGAGKYDRIPKVVMCCVGTVTVIGLSMGCLMYILGPQLLSFYARGNPYIIEAGMKRVSVFAFTYFTCGLMDVGCGIMRGMGKSLTPMIVSLLGSCAFRILWIYTICKLFPGDIFVLYLSYPISWVLTLAVHYICSFFTFKKLKNEHITADASLSEAL